MSETPESEETSAWPLADALERLESISSEDLRGTSRLGALAFGDEPQKVEEIVGMLRDLRDEDWFSFDEASRANILGQVGQVVGLVDQMMALDSGVADSAAQKNNLVRSLDGSVEWFKLNVKPRLLQAPIKRALASASVGVGESDVAAVRDQLEELQGRLQLVSSEIRSLAPVVEAQRQAAGRSGTEDLSADFVLQANDHRESWKRWLKATAGAVLVAIVGSLLVILIHHPSGKVTDASAFGRLALDLLVVGLLLYVVRLTSLQFRVHRHLEAVARNKAAALSTFSRIVATGTEASTRDALATTLAQSVFASGETGFVDSGNDHITLIERIVAPVAQRVTPS